MIEQFRSGAYIDRNVVEHRVTIVNRARSGITGSLFYLSYLCYLAAGTMNIAYGDERSTFLSRGPIDFNDTTIYF